MTAGIGYNTNVQYPSQMAPRQQGVSYAAPAGAQNFTPQMQQGYYNIPYYMPYYPPIPQIVIPQPTTQPTQLMQPQQNQTPVQKNNDLQNINTAAQYSKPQVQNPLNESIQTPLNAQMPAPNLQEGQLDLNAFNKKTQNKNPYIEPTGLNIGVVDAPQNYSKTPIIDSLNKQGQITQRTSISGLGGKGSRMTAGKLSSYCAFGSLGIILSAVAAKIIKNIRHK